MLTDAPGPQKKILNFLWWTYTDRVTLIVPQLAITERLNTDISELRRR
jgi:hypothetical protein